MTDQVIASFMERAVAADRQGTERLAQALEALAPDAQRKKVIVDLAKEEALRGELGAEAGFESMWDGVANAVMSYTLVSNLTNVSDEYGRELSSARRNAIDVERISDDPPERVQAWITSVTEAALAQLDLDLLLDLLRIEGAAPQWEPLAVIAVEEAERRTHNGDVTAARALLEALVRETKPDGRSELRLVATRVIDGLGGGPIARHVAMHFRTIIDSDVDRFNQLCQLLGPGVVRSLADALAREENAVAIRRLAALLLSFGAAGRRSVEQLKNSPNPAVRRTAITLLRRAGGQEALLELASMLGDAEPEVQRESIHAITEIGTANAFSILHRLLLEADTPRDSALRELLSLRDDKAVPLFSYVLTKGEPKGRLVAIHLSMLEALGTMRPRPESIRALQQVLSRGHWWAPFRTASQRQAAAASLRKLGTPEAVAVLEAAANNGPRAVRKIARAQIAHVAKREKSTT
jgi:HEAT repeat protein